MKPRNKLFNRTYIILIVVNLITTFGFSMISSIVSSYAVFLGADLTMAGALAGVFSLSALGIRPITGVSLDILNKKNMCILSTIMICISFIGYSFVQNIPMLFLFRVIHGTAFGVSSASSMALVSEYIPKERLGEGLGYFGLGNVLSRISGPYVGILIRDKYGYRSLFLIISVFTVLAVILLLGVKVKKREYGSIKDVFSSIQPKNLLVKECIVYALIAGLFSLGNGITSSFLVLLGDERGIANIALFFSVNAAALLILRLTAGKLVDRANLTFIVIISLVSTSTAMFLIGGASSLPIILLAAVLVALGQGTGQLSLQAACIRKVDVTKIGVATSTYYIGADIGQGLGPIIGGRISDLLDYRMTFYATAIIMLIGILIFVPYQIYDKKMTSKG